MHFNMSSWVAEHPDQEVICPYRVLDPATGFVIEHVTEFNDDEGWLRVLCRGPQQYEGQTNLCYTANGTGRLVSQILTIPFQVVPWFKGIDDLPRISLDTVLHNGGDPIGFWIPNDQPYHHTP